jgi:hypothetical protein
VDAVIDQVPALYNDCRLGLSCQDIEGAADKVEFFDDKVFQRSPLELMSQINKERESFSADINLLVLYSLSKAL